MIRAIPLFEYRGGWLLVQENHIDSSKSNQLTSQCSLVFTARELVHLVFHRMTIEAKFFQYVFAMPAITPPDEASLPKFRIMSMTATIPYRMRERIWLQLLQSHLPTLEIAFLFF